MTTTLHPGRAAAFAVLPLFALHVGLWAWHGAQSGGLLVEARTPLARADAVVFGLAYLAVALALWHAAAPVASRAVRLGGRALAAVAAVGTGLGVGGVLVRWQPVAFSFAAATLALFASALAVGAARWRAGDHATGAALVGFGATTLPLGFALPMLLPGLPEYAVYEAHLLAAGAWWAVAGQRTASRGPANGPNGTRPAGARRPTL